MSAVLLGLLLPATAAATLPLEGSHPEASANLEWLQVGTWFPVDFWISGSAGLYGVRMCKYDKVAIARDVATRPFDRPNVTAENCHAVLFEALKSWSTSD